MDVLEHVLEATPYASWQSAEEDRPSSRGSKHIMATGSCPHPPRTSGQTAVSYLRLPSAPFVISQLKAEYIS